MLPAQLKAKKKKSRLKASLWSKEADELVQRRSEDKARRLVSSVIETRHGNRPNPRRPQKSIVLSDSDDHLEETLDDRVVVVDMGNTASIGLNSQRNLLMSF
jgi:hypothetical protein